MSVLHEECGPYNNNAMSTTPSRQLDVFPNPAPQRDYLVHMECPEFTCVCPLTGQPDFATLVFDFVPDKLNLELKALKLYLWSWRNDGVFHEAVTNQIVDEIVARIEPRFLRLTAKWFVRGGIYTTVVVEHRARGWEPAPRIDLGTFDTPSSVRG